jgi:hypothetical protein
LLRPSAMPSSSSSRSDVVHVINITDVGQREARPARPRGAAGRSAPYRRPASAILPPRALAQLAEALAAPDGVGLALREGAPGWHLECSTMSIEYLGERFDRHTGGVDHIPVHHTNEIAQSEAYTGVPWVPFWLHNEFINLDHAKIAKSTGNALRLRDLERRGYHPLWYRVLLLAAHYRNQIDFSLGRTRGGTRRPPPAARTPP